MRLKIIRKIYRGIFPYKFSKLGKNVHIGDSCIISSPKKIEFGNNISIGPNAVLYSIYKRIIFKDNVVLGPHVTMVSGDHNIKKIGVSIIDNHDKEPEDDADIVVEEDVWIGANVTVLKGVTIGRGAVVGANALVIKDVLPYTIVGGVPARVISYRFSLQEVLTHEKILYSEDKRMQLTQLTHLS